MGRSVLASGELGRHNGLPATIIVTTTLQDLQSAAGVAVTASGTVLPMRDVIRLAAQSHHYLAVYDKHTREPLYCGRAKRFAIPGQRIVLGCRLTHPTGRIPWRAGCGETRTSGSEGGHGKRTRGNAGTTPVVDPPAPPGYWCQAHHIDGWAEDDGPTDFTKLAVACGPDNRLVEEGGWTTRKRTDGRTEWIPPPHLDTGQSRVNDYHQPEKYLRPEEEDDPD